MVDYFDFSRHFGKSTQKGDTNGKSTLESFHFLPFSISALPVLIADSLRSSEVAKSCCKTLDVLILWPRRSGGSLKFGLHHGEAF
jgi:hypothetical protein